MGNVDDVGFGFALIPNTRVANSAAIPAAAARCFALIPNTRVANCLANYLELFWCFALIPNTRVANYRVQRIG